MDPSQAFTHIGQIKDARKKKRLFGGTLFGDKGLLAPIKKAVTKKAHGQVSDFAKNIEDLPLGDLDDDELDDLESKLDAYEDEDAASGLYDEPCEVCGEDDCDCGEDTGVSGFSSAPQGRIYLKR